MSHDEIYLQHVLDAIAVIQGYIQGMDYERFKEDKLRQDGVIRELEIIGEAARNLSKEYKNSVPRVPWEDITGMRDKLIHQYFGVNLRMVWDTIQEDIPLLKKELFR